MKDSLFFPNKRQLKKMNPDSNGPYKLNQNLVEGLINSKYNPLKGGGLSSPLSFFSFAQDLIKGNLPGYQESLKEIKKKKADDQIKEFKETQRVLGNEISDKQLLEDYPGLNIYNADAFDKAIAGGKASVFWLGRQALKPVKMLGQKIGETAKAVPMVGEKLVKFLPDGFYDPKKTKPEPVKLFSADGSFNSEAFYDPNRKSLSDAGKDIALKPLSVIMKMAGSSVAGGIFITILGPIGFIPMMALNAVSYSSQFQSIAIEIPKDIFTAIVSTAINGFKDSGKNCSGIEIELSDEDGILIKDENGIIIGKKELNETEKSSLKYFNNLAKEVSSEINSINQKLNESEKASLESFNGATKKVSSKINSIKQNNDAQSLPDLNGAEISSESHNQNSSTRSFVDSLNNNRTFNLENNKKGIGK